MADYDRNENLLLWQALTSDRIPLADIDEAVYHDSLNEFYDHLGFSPEKTDNLFYIYLSNTNDSEITDFLGTAKNLEEQWRNTRSPWYYPSSRDAGDNADDDGSFSEIIEQCKAYDGTRLRDRYALQAARALFASRRYPACIEFYLSLIHI